MLKNTTIRATKKKIEKEANLIISKSSKKDIDQANDKTEFNP
jgi:hypothetical protein